MPCGSLLPWAVQFGNPKQKHAPSTSFGDSGEPNFFEPNCSGWHRAYRLDTHQERSFFGEYVQLP